MYITEFYEDGYLRGDGGVCVPTDNEPQRVRRTVLVVICFLLSLLVALEWCVMAPLWQCGTMNGSSKGIDRQAIVHIHVHVHVCTEQSSNKLTPAVPNLPQNQSAVRN